MNPFYLIIGNGRVAKHLLNYFSLLGLQNQQYHYKEPIELLDQKLQNSTHVLVLIKDDVIEDFIKTKLLDKCANKLIIHCSGALESKYAYSAHPLMAFGDKLFDLETYKSVPFICESGSLKFKHLMPNVPNKDYYIDPSNKTYYHALCAIANNFTTILWQEVKNRFETQLKMDFKVMLPIMHQTIKNINDDIDNALTGPLKRNDNLTINKHLESLKNDELSSLYQEFVELYNKEFIH